MATWHEDIKSALQQLGGIATLEEIYQQVRMIRSEPHPVSFNAIVRRELQSRSSDSEYFQNGEDCFRSVDGIGSGVWGLRVESQMDRDTDSLGGSDIGPPSRVTRQVSRIIRDTALARSVKEIHNHKCQICDLRLNLIGRLYSEAHHIQPLGGGHDGPDVPENILIVCPNCHVLLDYASITLSRSEIREHPDHQIGEGYIDYHNRLHRDILSASD